jgi:hypothetical protein
MKNQTAVGQLGAHYVREEPRAGSREWVGAIWLMDLLNVMGWRWRWGLRAPLIMRPRIFF